MLCIIWASYKWKHDSVAPAIVSSSTICSCSLRMIDADFYLTVASWWLPPIEKARNKPGYCLPRPLDLRTLQMACSDCLFSHSMTSQNSHLLALNSPILQISWEICLNNFLDPNKTVDSQLVLSYSLTSNNLALCLVPRRAVLPLIIWSFRNLGFCCVSWSLTNCSSSYRFILKILK